MKIRLAQKLYGRDQELQTLRDAVAEASTGKPQFVWIGGNAGMGKSALVYTTLQSTLPDQNHVVVGKFDQILRSMPYGAMIFAFREFIRQLLGKSDEELAPWKAKLHEALGPNAAILIDLMPELALLMGSMQPVPALGPSEAQNRFDTTFFNFIHALAPEEHPLFLALDDLQWADPGSLRQLQRLMTDSQQACLCVVGLYRDNEVDTAHLLQSMLDQLQTTTGALHLKLGPVGGLEADQLIADMLDCPLELARPLANYVVQKTGGNPFFMQQLVLALNRDGILSFDGSAATWRWDEARALTLEIPVDIIDFLIARLKLLPAHTQDALCLAACIGHQFDLKTLATIYEKPIANTIVDLQDAFDQRLILLRESRYSYKQPTSATQSLTWRFLHDRVQQAFYSLIEDEKRPMMHLRIGQILQRQQADTPYGDKIFTIVNHLNIGSPLLKTSKDRRDLADQNLAAARRAKASTDFQSAASYLSAGIGLLDEESWQTATDLALHLYVERAECEYLIGSFDTAETLFDELLRRMKKRLDRAKILTMRMTFYSAVGRNEDALRVGFAALELFGIKVPDSDLARTPLVVNSMELLNKQLAHRSAQDLLKLPKTTRIEDDVLMDVLVNLVAPAYMRQPNLFTFAVVKLMNLSLGKGHTEASAYGYVNYGLILATTFARYREGRDFGKLAIALGEAFENKSLLCKLCFSFGIYSHLLMPLRSGVAYFDRAYQLGLEVFDFIDLSYACTQSLTFRFGMGECLDDLSDRTNQYIRLMDRTKVISSKSAQIIVRQVIASLQGRTQNPQTLSDDQFDETAFVNDVIDRGLSFAISWYYTAKSMLLYLHGDYTAAKSMVSMAEQRIGSSTEFYFTTELCFYACLVLAALYPDASEKDQQRALDDLNQRKVRLESWAHGCKENFKHKVLLVRAEIARLGRRDAEAWDFYEQAITSAREHGFVQNEALANELCGRVHLAGGRINTASGYILEAHRCYRQWGATSMVNKLVHAYPEFLANTE